MTDFRPPIRTRPRDRQWRHSIQASRPVCHRRYPLDGNRTRLVTRGTGRCQNTLGTWAFMRVMEPAAFIMTRRMLLGLTQSVAGWVPGLRLRSPASPPET